MASSGEKGKTGGPRGENRVGVAAIVAIAWGLSERRTAVRWRAIGLGLALDNNGAITQIGLRAHACAIGQAAAAIFAEGAASRDAKAIQATEAEIAIWLTGGPQPDWPMFEAIAAARAYPARHGAILLPWKAALAALP